MAVSPDGKFLYPLLEGPLLTASGEPEAKDGKRYLRILEFDGLGPVTYTWKAGATELGTGSSLLLGQAHVGQAYQQQR